MKRPNGKVSIETIAKLLPYSMGQKLREKALKLKPITTALVEELYLKVLEEEKLKKEAVCRKSVLKR